MKYRGKFAITREMMERILALPFNVDILNFEYDNKREILYIAVTSDEEVEGFTIGTGEGMEAQSMNGEIIQEGILQASLEIATNMIATGRASLTLEDDEEC